MNGPWATRVPLALRAHVAALRLTPDVLWLDTNSHTWLRGDAAPPPLWTALAALPGSERFTVDAAGRCRAPGAHLPTASLPAGEWRPLRQWPPPTLAPSALPAAAPPPCPLTLQPGTDAAPANLLRTDLRALAQ